MWLVDLFVGISAPELILLYPAAEPVTGKAAPAIPAAVDRGHAAGLEIGGNGGVGRRGGADRSRLATGPRRDHGGALARQEALEDPADRPIGIAHAAPGVELLDDFDRKADAGEHPSDLVVLAGPDAHVDAARLEADETRNRQAALAGGDSG